MTLNGSIQTISLYGIIQLLCNEHKTGILRVIKDKEEYQSWMVVVRLNTLELLMDAFRRVDEHRAPTK